MLEDENSPTPTPGSEEPEQPVQAVTGDDTIAGAEPLADSDTPVGEQADEEPEGPDEEPEEPDEEPGEPDDESVQVPAAPMVLFQVPETRPVRRRRPRAEPVAQSADDDQPDDDQADDAGPEQTGPEQTGADAVEAPRSAQESGDSGDAGDDDGGQRRRRRRGGRRRRKGPDSAADSAADSGAEPAGGDSAGADDSDERADAEPDTAEDEGGDSDEGGSRRRRRRRRAGDEEESNGEDPEATVTRVRKQRNPEDEITGVSGSTRLEAKKQRRREGREAGRRRAPIVSEAEFLARREAVDRVMVIRQKGDLTQIGVLEDRVLVEHYVARESQTSLIGNVYLGRVQNVLPSMEAAFVDIGKGRNAVLYAGEVNWSALGHKDGQPRKIESVLSSGQTVLVQVTKDPIGHKGARLTGQISLPGRFLVFVPDGNTSGISRKLPDTERNRLKSLLKEIVPDSAGVIVRTAAEGASEEELTHDVERLTARWADIEQKVQAGKAPQLLYGEPDLTLKVVRDLFTEDFAKLVVQGDDAWDLVDGYVSHVAPDLRERLERFEPAEEGPDAGKDLFAAYRVDEQIAKGLDRKVWLPSGGSLIIDRTEAMTVVDVNTGKFTGSGGNLEETVTKNNLEAAEEIVRQLRLRDIGGIIVIDFIDMVLESNRDLVLRRLVECLGRDRTRHQVAEVTSLGLVQMTRKRIGTGLLEAFSTECEHCKGRGIVLHDHPVEQQRAEDERGRRGRGGRARGGRSGGGNAGNGSGTPPVPTPADLAASRPPEKAEKPESSEAPAAPEQPEQLGQLGQPGRPELPDAGKGKQPEEPSGKSGQPGAAEQTEHAVEQTDALPAAAASPDADTPRVTTTTRRRGARRPAGPPSGSGSASPSGAASSGAGDGGPAGVAGMQAPASAEPFEVPVEPAVPGHSPSPEGSRDPSDDDSGDENDSEESGVSSLLHVPIKKKGSRKR